MTIDKFVRYTYRTDRETLDKLRYVADDSFRTLNSEIDMLVKRHINNFEKKYGPIKI